MRLMLALEFFMTPVFHLKNKNNLSVEQILGDHTECSTGCLCLACGPALVMGAVTPGSVLRLGGCSSFPPPCSRGLEALATDKMGRNKQKNKVMRTSGSETVSQKSVMLSCSLLSWYQCALMLRIQTLLCLFQVWGWLMKTACPDQLLLATRDSRKFGAVTVGQT